MNKNIMENDVIEIKFIAKDKMYHPLKKMKRRMFLLSILQKFKLKYWLNKFFKGEKQ